MSSVPSSPTSIFDRATTPSSICSGIDGSDIQTFQFPSVFVYLSSFCPEQSLLKAVFDAYAKAEHLGLCLPTISENEGHSIFSGWSEQYIVPSGCTESVKMLVSTFGDIPVGQDPSSYAPVDANEVSQHLLSFSLAGFRSVLCVPSVNFVTYIIEKPSIVFRPLSHSHGNVPTVEEWQTLWSTWDLVTGQMISAEMLHQKPIDLRHKPLFYIGHIPTFLDMLLDKAIGGGPSEPAYFWKIFERGIDPHVDDSSQCHSHSDVPEKDDDWPSIAEIVTFRDRVRARLMQLYDDLKSGKQVLTMKIARTLVMTLEHEGFHIETLLYMLIQRAGSGTLPPPGITTPPWDLFQHQWNSTPPPESESVILGPTTVTLGHSDSEKCDEGEEYKTGVESHVFGWDNENPERKYEVRSFGVEWRPVSNLEYMTFWKNNGLGLSGMPASWVREDGEVKVRTLYGPVPMKIAQHWPVLTSYEQLAAYAQAKGGRLPTEPELRLFLDLHDVGYEGGGNSGFRNWHPIPATTGIGKNYGKCSNGGVWEWTSSLFDAHEGLFPTKLFPGYSTDFFDGKHNVVLGSSYATIPRLAGRRTIRNFYQPNYPYAWVGGRVVYEL